MSELVCPKDVLLLVEFSGGAVCLRNYRSGLEWSVSTYETTHKHPRTKNFNNVKLIFILLVDSNYNPQLLFYHFGIMLVICCSSAV